MTANAMAEDRRLCLEAGMDDYLAKPISIERLRQVLERLEAQGEAGEGESTPVHPAAFRR